MPTRPVELTEAEWTIIKAVWKAEPCTAPGIRQRLLKRTRWTYSTVRTLMDRMVIKGLLRIERAGYLTRYRSAISPGQAQRSELLYALKHAFDGALTPMVQCLLDTQELSAEELEQIAAIVESRKRASKRPR